MANDSIGNASHLKTGPILFSMRTEHDQIRLPFFGRIEDHNLGIALFNVRRDLKPCVAQCLGGTRHQCLGLMPVFLTRDREVWP